MTSHFRRGLEDTLNKIASEDIETPEPIMETKPVAPPAVTIVTPLKKKSPAKEVWKVAQIEFKSEQESSWRCNQPKCRHPGVTDAAKMRHHLSFHKLSQDDIDQVARDVAAMNAKLQKLVRTVYKGSCNETVGTGPRTLVATGEALANEEFTCLAMQECVIALPTEEELLDHLRQFHPPIAQ